MTTTRASQRRASPIRARLSRVSIANIHVTGSDWPPVEAAAKALQADPNYELFANLLRPPLLVPFPDRPKHYTIIGNLLTFARQQQLAGTDANRDASVMAIVLTTEDVALPSIGPILERYLVPLLLGELSVRHAAAARCKLRDAGVSAPKPISTRAALRRLVKRSTVANDA